MNKKNMFVVLVTILLIAVFISACGNTSEQGDTKNDNQDKSGDETTNSDDDMGEAKNDNSENEDTVNKNKNNDKVPKNEDEEKESSNNNDSNSVSEEEEKALSNYNSEEIEYARIWLQIKNNMDINELNVIYIEKGELVNPYDNESVKYPEDAIMLLGKGVAGNPGVVYSGNGDGTINLYDIPSHWQDGVEPEDKTMKEYTKEIVEKPEEVYIEPRNDKDVEELIQK